MREIPLANCAKEFVQAAASQKQRLDGRHQYDYRKLRIAYGVDRGCCHVHLGDTKVLAQVSGEVVEPKLHRPTDGVLFVNVEMSPMTSPSVEFGRPSDHCVEIQRVLERTLRESRCLDLESLCIVSSKQVWQIRVDVHCLNNAGNLLDACSIAGIAALSHFRLPDVTITGEEVTIHSLTERDPIPLSIHHMPICCTFAFFSQGKVVLFDPDRTEERVMEGKLVVGMNKHRELCCLQSAGSMLLMRDQVMRCSNLAVRKVTEVSDLIHRALENDRKARSSGENFGFAESDPSEQSRPNEASQDAARLKELLGAESIEDDAASDDNATSTTRRTPITDRIDPMDTDPDSKVKSIGEGGKSTWVVDDDEMSDVISTRAHVTGDQSKSTTARASKYDLDSDEEDITHVLNPEQFRMKSAETKKPTRKKKRK